MGIVQQTDQSHVLSRAAENCSLHVWVSWKVYILLPDLVMLAHNMTRKGDESNPSLTSKAVQIGMIKAKIVRPVFMMRMGLQQMCNWIPVPLQPQFSLSLPCYALVVPGSVQTTGSVTHDICDLCAYKQASWAVQLHPDCNLRTEQKQNSIVKEILRPEMPYVAVPPLQGLCYRFIPQYFLNLHKVWEIFLFAHSLQWTKNAVSILPQFLLDL